MFIKSLFSAMLIITGTMSFNASASSISATALTISEAQKKIEKKASEKGVDYEITGAHYGNHVYMIARTKLK